MNREKAIGLVFGTLMAVFVTLFVLGETNRTWVTLLMVPLLAWPLIAFFSEVAGGIMALTYAILGLVLFFVDAFGTGKTVQAFMRFLFILPVPALLVGLLMFYAVANRSKTQTRPAMESAKPLPPTAQARPPTAWQPPTTWQGPQTPPRGGGTGNLRPPG
ncbi:MAG TPA: hypothetical protein ENN60_02540 [archaeon]|nr:hypothetical protein [archaeon]